MCCWCSKLFSLSWTSLVSFFSPLSHPWIKNYFHLSAVCIMKSKTSVIDSIFLSALACRSPRCLWHLSSAFWIDELIMCTYCSFALSSSLSSEAALSIESISCPLWESFRMQSMHTGILSVVQKASNFLKCLLHVLASSSVSEKSQLPDLEVYCWICKRAQFCGKSSVLEYAE